MKKYPAFILFLLAIVFMYPVPSSAKSLQIKIFPRRISPGDAFVVKVTGVRKSSVPAVLFADNELPLIDCGKGCYLAIGAVDINVKPKSYAVKIKDGRKNKSLRFVVKRKKFPEIHLSLPDEKVVLSPENLNRVEEENKKLAEIFQNVTEGLWDGNFIMPLDSEISTVFGTKRIMNEEWTSVHKGADLRGREGDSVEASNGGRVVLAEELFFGGNTIILDHGQGIYTIYMHLSRFNVKLLDYVEKADTIGFVGSTGRATGPHLHFGVKVMGINANPVSLTKLKLS